MIWSQHTRPCVDEHELVLVHRTGQVFAVEDRVDCIRALRFPVLGSVAEVLLREGLVQCDCLVRVSAGWRSRVCRHVRHPGVPAGPDVDREIVRQGSVDRKHEDDFILVSPTAGFRGIECPGEVPGFRDLPGVDRGVSGDMDGIQATTVRVDVIRAVQVGIPPYTFRVCGADEDAGVVGECPAMTSH